MKLIVAGCRNFGLTPEERAAIFHQLDALSGRLNITEIISGCARGVDSVGIEWAQSHNIAVARFPADWDKHGKAAGPIRNEQMAKYAETDGMLLAFWDNQSPGTRNMIENAQKYGLKLEVVIH